MSSPNSANSAIDPGRPPSLPSADIEERVRYAETDGMGIAYHGNYFTWFEMGRTELCRRRGLAYKDIEAMGYFIVVAEATCRYRRPLRYDDRFVVRTYLTEATPKKIVFAYEVTRPEDPAVVCATGETVHVVVDREGKVTPLPEDVLKRILRPETG
jgi:acyl-CoA thioester hydrolase